jgi:hypothetical protein
MYVRPSADQDIGSMGEVVICRYCCRHDHDPHRLETSAAQVRIGSFASVTAGPSFSWLITIAISANALPSPPAGPMKHTAPHRRLRRPPTPGDHRHRDRDLNRRLARRCA